jgi:hypothetical protein
VLGSVGRDGVVGRFARWGLSHGPWWGALGGAVVAAPATALMSLPVEGLLTTVLAGTILGLLAGPALGVLVGLTCLAADRAPKWILDAPDYVAVSTVVLVVGTFAWPLLHPSMDGLLVGLIAVVVLALAPAVDAARNAETLLHPSPARHRRGALVR